MYLNVILNKLVILLITKKKIKTQNVCLCQLKQNSQQCEHIPFKWAKMNIWLSYHVSSSFINTVSNRHLSCSNHTLKLFNSSQSKKGLPQHSKIHLNNSHYSKQPGIIQTSDMLQTDIKITFYLYVERGYHSC